MRSSSPSISTMANRILWVLLLLFASLGSHGFVSSSSDDGIKKVNVPLNLQGTQSSKDGEKNVNPNTCLAPRFRSCTSFTWARSTTTTPQSSRRCTMTRSHHSSEGFCATKIRSLFSMIKLFDNNNSRPKRESQLGRSSEFDRLQLQAWILRLRSDAHGFSSEETRG